MIRKIYFLFIISIFFLPALTEAETFVNGEILENTTWNKFGSPYILEGDLIIPESITLTVESDVSILSRSGANIIVYGGLIANGAYESNIKIESDIDYFSPWNIFAFDGANVEISFSDLKDVESVYFSGATGKFDNVFLEGKRGIDLHDGSFASIFNSHIYSSDYSSLSLFSSEASVLDSFLGSSDSYYQVELHNGSNLNALGIDFDVSSNSVIGVFDSRANLEEVKFNGGFDSAIEVYSSDLNSVSEVNIKKADISGFLGYGVQAYNSNINLRDSDIYQNSEAFLFIPSYVGKFSISNSNIYGNEIGAEFYPATGFENSFDAKNNWWGDASGPYHINNQEGKGDGLFGLIKYIPWLQTKVGEVCCSSVLFLPGLEASRLYKKGIFEDQLWEPNINADVKDLYLKPDGTSVNSEIYTRDIINRTNIGFGLVDQNVYKSFSESMDRLMSEGVIQSWKPIPYDWRFDFDEIINNGIKLQDKTIYIISELEKLAKESKTKKVTIITHSNGGLLAKVLVNKLKELGKEGLVEKIIMVAPPELGTSQTVGGLLHGDEQNLTFVLDKDVAKGLGENMKSAFNLLPSQKYFEIMAEPIIEFDQSVDKVSNLRDVYGDKIDSYQELKDFLIALNDKRKKPLINDIVNPNVLNKNLIEGANNIHDSIDEWVVSQGIELIKIAGWGINTTKGIRYFARETCEIEAYGCKFVLDHELIKTIDGDYTVVSPSVVLGTNNYYVNMNKYNSDSGKNIDHKSILEITNIESFLKNIIQNKNNILPQYITSEKPTDPNNKNLKISMHSPVAIDVYDSEGRHTGVIKNPDPNSDINFVEENIPNSSYEEVGEGKYIYMNGDASTALKLQGLDTGTFTLNITKSESGQIIEQTNFIDIPTTSNMEGEVIVSSSTPSLLLDIEGDGKKDIEIKSNQELDPITYLTIIKKMIEGFDINKKLKSELIKKIDSIIKSIEKGNIKNVTKKVKDFNKKIKSLTKKEFKKHQHGKISKEDGDILIKIINDLLNNLE